MLPAEVSVALSVGSWFAEQVTSATMLVALPIAAVAGAVSFLSPCVLPLLPGYLSYVTGVSAADLERAGRNRLLLGATGFVLGFTAVFVTAGLAFGALGTLLVEHQRLLSIILGALTILLGLAFLLPVGPLSRDLRVHKVPAVGVGAAPLLGVLFGLGWTPCIGPTLAAVMNLALTTHSATRGAVLAVAYSLGLGIPFVLMALGYRRLLGAFKAVRRHQRTVVAIGGGMLVVVGVLLVTGVWGWLIGQLQTWIAGTGAAL